MGWVEQHSGLWGLLALVVALIAGAPAFASLRIAVRDARSSSDDLHARLRATAGRIGVATMQTATVGTRAVLPISVADGGKPAVDAVAHLLDRVAAGDATVVVGPGGTGKSQLLHEVHSASYRLAAGPQDPLVEVVALDGLRRRFGRSGVEAHAVRAIAARYRLSRRAVATLVAESRLVLAFDALDEVPAEDRPRLWRELVEHASSRPLLLTTRRPEDDGGATGIDLGEVAHGHRGGVVAIRPLAWTDVASTLTDEGLVGVEDVEPHVREHLSTPLALQMMLHLHRSGRTDEEAPAAVLGDPDTLLHRFVGLDGHRGPDRAARLGALLIADADREGAGAFRPFPLQLGGLALRLTPLLALVGVAGLGLLLDRPISALAIGVALLLCSPYLYGDPLKRLVMRLGGERSSVLWVVLPTVAALAITHLARIAVWSVQARALDLGDWSDLLDLYYLSLAGVVMCLIGTSPMSLSQSPASWGRTMHARWWPHVLLLAVSLGLLLTVHVGALVPLLFGAVVCTGTTCLFLAVSAVLGWVVVGRPPWEWPGLVDDLVRRGVLCRVGTHVKFTHARIEQQLLWSLANDPATPALLWRVFGVHWSGRMLADPLVRAGLRSTAAGAAAVRTLSRWSTFALTPSNEAYCYLQWIAVDPDGAADLMRRHRRVRPGPLAAAMHADALDRLGDGRGAGLARRLLDRGGLDRVALHYCLRVLERHESPSALLRVADALERRSPSDESLRATLEHRRRVWASPGGAPSDSDRFALEAEPPDLDLAAERVRALPETSQRHARLAVLHALRGERDEAPREIARATALIGPYDGYDEVLETVLVAAALGQDPWAVRWTTRAAASGLRLVGRDGLRRNLGITRDHPFAALFASTADPVISERVGDPVLQPSR